MSKKNSRFDAAMKMAKLRQIDMARLAGVDRRTVWRWKSGRTPVPEYAWTIVRLQQRVRVLTAELCETRVSEMARGG